MRGAITVFLIFHILAIVVWSLPSDARPIVAVREVIAPYMLWTGLYQSWDMFAPNPKSKVEYIKAVVITKNRHMPVFGLPRMEELSYSARYQKERYRKFVENVLLDKNAAVWPDMIRHIARIYSNTPSDLPDKVILIRFDSEIQPGQNAIPEPKPSIFYDDAVQDGDLQ